MALENIKEQIQMLVELQAFDSEVFEKKGLLERIPEKIKDLDNALSAKSENLKTSEEEFKKLQLQRKDKEMELETKEGAIKKYQTQLFQIKTNQEYAAMEKQIGSIKADNSALEEEVIVLLDRAEEAQKKVSREKGAFEAEKSKVEEGKKEIELERKKAEEIFNEFTNKRNEFAKKLDKNILSKYERILHNRNGLAVVPVVADACGGCNMNLPPQVVNEARMKSSLTLCGNCARILYANE